LDRLAPALTAGPCCCLEWTGLAQIVRAMAYFFVRYGFLTGRIARFDFVTGVVLGVLTVGAFLTFVPPVLIPALVRRRG